MRADLGGPAAVRRSRKLRVSPCLVARRLPDPEFEALYRALYSSLVSRARWRFRLPSEDARDIVQDAFAIALTRLDLASNPRAWLIQVVDYLSMNVCRKNRRRAELLSRWSAEVFIDLSLRDSREFKNSTTDE